METLFWISAACLFYAYLGYGLLAWAWSQGRSLWVPANASQEAEALAYPSMAFVIPAFQEAEGIVAKVQETLSLDYPPGRLRVVVVTDGSTDGTAALVSQIPGILHLHNPQRLGKAAALNSAMLHLGDTELVCFSDANAQVSAGALRAMAAWFRHPSVGAVAGEKHVRRDAATLLGGESVYWRYESAMKRLDAAMHSAIGAAGELFCIRRNLLRTLPADMILDDLYLSLQVCCQGYRIAYEPAAMAKESPSLHLQDEVARKVRIAAGAFQCLRRCWPVVLPWPDPLLAFQFISRRLFRWVICPLAIPVLYGSNLLLVAGNPTQLFYVSTLSAQTIFHVLAWLGWLRARQVKPSSFLLHLPFYFDMMHVCMWIGFLRYMNGRQTGSWQKAAR